jgi:galactofuranose transport system permease protein
MKPEYVTPPRHAGNSPLPESLIKLVWPLAALVLLLLFNAIFTPNFFKIGFRDGAFHGSLIDILNHGGKVMLLAIGMCLVIATRGVDLSVGAVMAISGAISVTLVRDPQASLWLAVTAAMAVAVAAGAWNGVLVSLLRIQPIVATLILMVAGRGVAQLITQGFIPTTEHSAFTYIGNGKLLGLPFPIMIVLLVLLMTWLVTRRTAIGLFIESVGDNERASHFAGINARTVKFMVYTFSGFCAGLAGLVAASNIKAADSNNAGLFLELDAIIAVVVGGTALTGGRFYLLGAITGALLIQTLTTTLYMRDVNPFVIPVYKATVVLAVCMIQSPVFRAQLLMPFRGRAA